MQPLHGRWLDAYIGHRLELDRQARFEQWRSIEERLESALGAQTEPARWLSGNDLHDIVGRAKLHGHANKLREVLGDGLDTGTMLGRPLRLKDDALAIAAEFLDRPDLVKARSLVRELERAMGPGPEGPQTLTEAECTSFVKNAREAPCDVLEIVRNTIADALRRGMLFGETFSAPPAALTILMQFTGVQPSELASRLRVDGAFRALKLANREQCKPKQRPLIQIAQAARSSRLATLASLQRFRKNPLSGIVARSLLATSRVAPVAHPDTAAHARYDSKLKNVTADDAFRFFVSHLRDVFASARLTILPAGVELRDGARFLLDEAGPPPMLLPLEVRIDEAKRSVSFLCLTGHPFAGENRFRFVPSKSGRSTLVQQQSIFEGTSPMIWLGQAMGAMGRQTDAWRSVHDFLKTELVTEDA